MKYLKIGVLFLSAIMFSCEGVQSPTEKATETGTTARNYFPGGVNSTFDYSVDAVDTSTQARTTFATQKGEIVSSEIIGDTLFLMSSQLSMFGFGGTNLDYYFRRTDFGVYLQMDSSSVFGLAPLPDSLIPAGTEFQVDPEINIFSFPLFERKNWNAYQANIVFGGITYIPIVGIKAFYEGSENIIVPAISGEQTAEKIRFHATILIPDVADTTSSLPQFNKTEFDLFAWFEKDVGLIKMESGPGLVNLIAQNAALPTDSTTILSWQLTAYEIK